MNLRLRNCTCVVFQELQFPCIHAAAVIAKCQLPLEEYIHSSYLSSSLRLVYTEKIVPVDLDLLNNDGETTPSQISRKVGRPKSLRIRSRGEVGQEDRLRCGICGERGHNARTHNRRQAGALGQKQGRKKKKLVTCQNCKGNHYKKTLCSVAIERK